MSGSVLLGGVAVAGVLALPALWRGYLGPALALRRIEREVTALRGEVVGYRTAHEHLMTSLERRLSALEQTTAVAANELRMASDQIMTRRRT